MKNIVVLYCACSDEFESERIFDGAFAGHSVFELVLGWAKRNGEKTVILADEACVPKIKEVVADSEELELISKKTWTNSDVIHEIAENCKKNSADHALFSFADTPFLNDYLTKELVNIHTKYTAEYSFADGYPYGLTPEVVNCGCASILAALTESVQKKEGDKAASRDGIFSVMKGDINSFEIETMLSDEDYRMLRVEFECSDKINFEVCKNAFDIENDVQKIGEAFARGDTGKYLSSHSLIKSLPAFYNIQISGNYNHECIYNPKNISSSKMNIEDFRKIVKKIADFSEKAVISLSCFGEPLLHEEFTDFVAEVLKYKKLSVLVETDGTLVTKEIAEKISSINTENSIDWIIYLDAMDKKLYSQIHSCPEEDFDKAVEAVRILEGSFAGHVYPQLIRMKLNEHDLEAFYRFWKEESSPSHGRLIIQKYNSMCGLLPDEKSTDLSPLERNPCWHLRRDLVVLSDGTVPLCRQCMNIAVGNVLENSIESVWKKFNEVLENHINKIYSETCRICDEFYTFNF